MSSTLLVVIYSRICGHQFQWNLENTMRADKITDDEEHKEFN